MAYINATFYIYPVSGSDTARTALTSCTASNPSGSITRINKTAHGLVTGAIVDTTLFTAWLNGAFKITVVDADNFDLDDTVWQATADPSGTVTPRGGSSWSDAWKTVGSGATAARIQSGDQIRFPKNAVTSAGADATFTSGSKTVTLSAALNKTVEHAVSGWTASTNITGSTNASRKYGATATVMTPASGFTTGKVCYKTIDGGGTQDFSGYTKISLWFRPITNTVITASTYKLCLCSDTTGDTIVNELNIPATQGTASWHIFVLDYGAALSSSVQSVAIYANSDPGTTAFSFNNIVACNNFTHESLFGWQSDCFHNVQAIDGATITIDAQIPATGGRGWYGTNGTAGFYYANPYSSYATGTINSVNEGATLGLGRTEYTGGWDTGTNTRDGYTYFASNIVGNGIGFGAAIAIKIANFVVARTSTSLSLASSTKTIIENVVITGAASNSGANAIPVFFKNCKILNQTFSSYGGYIFEGCDFFSSPNYSISINGPTKFVNCNFQNNGSGSVQMNNASLSAFDDDGGTYFRNCLFGDSTEMNITTNTYGLAWSYKHDQTDANNWGFVWGGTINWQTTTKQGSDPGAWRVVHTSIQRSSVYPIRFKVGEFALSASSAATFTAWVKKDHATDVECQIKVEGEAYTLEGITETADVKGSDTNWEQLSITFTPTESGIVSIWYESWYVSGNSNTYIGSVTCTQ